MEYHKCSICGQIKSVLEFYKKDNNSGTLTRKVSYDCRVCRSTTRQLKKGNESAEICERCQSPAHLASNKQCKRCLRQQGLKECGDCGEVLPQEIFFNKRRGTCKDCSSAVASVLWALKKRQAVQIPHCQEATSGHGARPDQPDNSAPSSHP